ncbi:MAG: 30S ribosome-binding factor RbfA [Planctomycetota bacterium]|jgi:ribosome-binding factor A|nr:MAG: 30S ribosome-binding factor RbfA [Planctomycetota bacterium]
MSSRRTAKVAEAIRQVVSTAILFELRDPRVQNVTVLRVETPVDLRTSKIYVSVLGDEKTQRLTMKGLTASCGFLQSKIAKLLDLRFTPVLTFILDQGVKKSIETSRLLRKLDIEDASRAPHESVESEDQETDLSDSLEPSTPDFDSEEEPDDETE